MKLKFFKNSTKNKIETIGKEVQALINIELQNSQNLDSQNPLNQVGMANGFEIINEYNSVREYGLAFEHVLYMIDETGIKVDKTSSELIKEMSKEMSISINHILSQLKY